MTATPADVIADEVLDILAEAERMEALSRTRPHVFAEQKDGLVQRLKDLHSTIRDSAGLMRLPVRTTTFRPGHVVSRKGRVVVAEVRRARPVHAR